MGQQTISSSHDSEACVFLGIQSGIQLDCDNRCMRHNRAQVHSGNVQDPGCRCSLIAIRSGAPEHMACSVEVGFRWL